MRKAVRVLLVSVTVGGILFLFVLPGRTWLDQQRAMSKAQHQILVLTKENAELAQKASQLQSTPYIERTATQDYGLQQPGAEAFAILPPTVTTTTTTAPAPKRSSP
jgi:cell division protein FtsB